MLIPKRVKRRKQHKGKMRGAAHKGNVIAYGEYGLVAEECGWIKSNQIEAARIAMTRFVKRGGQVWIDIFPHKPITKHPAEARMGSGKGNVEYWGCRSETRQSNVRNGGRFRSGRERGYAPCRQQTSRKVQVCEKRSRNRSDGRR